MYRFIKRTFDFCSSLLLFLVISPIFVVLMILVYIYIGRPVFFRQERTGKGMKRFNMIKFRTMTDKRASDGNLLPDEQRQTRFGTWLRSTSLDELPELLNIIKGDMSVIGPRPLPPIYDEYYTKTERSRFLVRGGLITPDSVDPDPIITWDKQLAYEADYGSNLSCKKDMKIFWGVFHILFTRNKTNYGSFVREPLNVERKNYKNE